MYDESESVTAENIHHALHGIGDWPRSSSFSPRSLDWLKKALPNCEIYDGDAFGSPTPTPASNRIIG
jgi:hypothetical protein